ncbi:hypothetical protein BCR35DRAFT_354136 [Leucosporidium creatinivorum]|uniref:Integral membrane protein n=1 Tax=Leucosporidium creatinivorum TaxID=106004 RepID=A0A1Y2EQ89_9BASI|nr:hypothetical protein BCR35DRAFT_354136 [Leucosporidium creatinivorum]
MPTSPSTPLPTGARPSNPPPSSHLPQPLRALQLRLQKLQDTSDPSTLPFLRAYAIGFAASFLPALLRVLLSSRRVSVSKLASRSLKALQRALSPRGLAMGFGVAVGGAKWGESRVEGAVRASYFAGLRKLEARRRGKRPKIEEIEEDEEATRKATDKHEAIVKALSTFLSATLASFVSISLLQSRSPSSPKRRQPEDTADLQLGFSPYQSLTTEDAGASTARRPPSPSSAILRPAVQSPTLDLSLFIFVRATDVFVRGLYEATAITSGRRGALLAFLASHADTLVFWASCWRIMWCWFYLPDRLPPTYNKWILKLARMDPRLLRLLQYARNNEYVYGQRPSREVAIMCEEIASGVGREASFVNPQYLKRLDCSVVHGKVGRGTCEANAVKRFIAAFRDCLLIYLPVHLVPQLLFNLKGLSKSPSASIIHILLAASRSSAFLATFVASIYASVCLVRTRIPLLLLPNINPQIWDSGLCTGLGCFLCGFSVLIENKRRRREMALYVAPRALYATMEELVPRFLLHGKAADALARWAEKSIFALSTGTVVSAAVHRPDLVSGVVRGVVGYAVGDWGGKGVSRRRK